MHNKCTSNHADLESNSKMSVENNQETAQMHHMQQHPGIVSLPVVINPVPPMNAPTAQSLQRIPRLPEGLFNHSIPFVAQPAPRTGQRGAAPIRIQLDHQPTSTQTAIPSTSRQRNITRHAINILTLKEQALFNTIYIPTKLMKHELPVHFEHYANLRPVP